jgi:hypothetical protein
MLRIRGISAGRGLSPHLQRQNRLFPERKKSRRFSEENHAAKKNTLVSGQKAPDNSRMGDTDRCKSACLSEF